MFSLCFFQLTVVPLLFSFCLTFLYDFLEMVTYCSLESVFLCGSIPIHTAWVQSLWWRARFDVVANLNFPQGVLTAITLAVGGLEMEELELASGVRWDYPSAH